MNLELYIKGQRLDLSDIEEVSVTQSIKDIQDISKIRSDFSQQFTIPASKRNNQIIKHWYNADIDNGFDARTRVDATLVLGTFDFKVGKIRLDGATVKHNVPENYKVTFFGKTLDLKNKIGNDKLFELPFLNNFNTPYSGVDVLNGLTTGFDFTIDGVTYDKAIIYPLISYFKQFYYNSDASDTTNSEDVVNIAYNGSNINGIEVTDLKPAIKLEVIIKAIEDKYGFTFGGSFFDSQLFKGIYMNLNNSVDAQENGFKLVEDFSIDPIASYGSSNIIRIRNTAVITPLAGFETVSYKVVLKYSDGDQNNDFIFYESAYLQGTQTHIGDVVESTVGQYTNLYNVKLEVYSFTDFSFDANFSVVIQGVSIQTVLNQSYPNQLIDLSAEVNALMPDIKVFDFLNSIFKMFNLIAYNDNENIFVDDLLSWYEVGQIYDVTKFVNTENLNIKKSKIFKEINYSFEDTEQIIGEQYKQSNNITYGNLEFKLTDANGQEQKDLDGEQLDIDVVFENPIFERLQDVNNNNLTSIQYCPYINRELKPISGQPFLFYALNRNIDPIAFNNGGGFVQVDNAFLPSHSQQIDVDSFNLNFDLVANEYTYNFMADTIYRRFWGDYVNDIFSIKRRIYNLKCYFPDNLLLKLKLNDKLIINDRRYIINKITSQLNKRVDSLELINDIFDAPNVNDTINTNVFARKSAIYGPEAFSDSVKFIASSTLIVKTTVGWINLSSNQIEKGVSNINFTIAQNTTGQDRVGFIVVNNIYKFTILQEG